MYIFFIYIVEQRFPCIIWNDLAIKLHEYIKNHESSTEPIIVLIKMARQSIWNRKYFF